jgi:hypothetical protein
MAMQKVQAEKEAESPAHRNILVNYHDDIDSTSTDYPTNETIFTTHHMPIVESARKQTNWRWL